MFRMGILPLLVILLAGVAGAEKIESNVSGRVTWCDGSSSARIRIVIEVDPFWCAGNAQGKAKLEKRIGKLVSRSNGRAVLLEGAAPRLKIRSPAVADPFYVYGTITPERCTLSRLFAGRWMVEVKSAGFAPGFIEVRLPVTARVKAALTAGGSAEVTLLGFDGKPARGRVFALKVGTPAHRHFVEKRALKWAGLSPSFDRMIGYFKEERSGRNAPHRRRLRQDRARCCYLR